MNKDKLIKILKTKKDITAKEYDGVYNLIPKVIGELSEIKNLNSLKLDYKDLDAIYFLCIGTWKSSFKNKRELVDKSNLPPENKNNINKFIEEEEEKTINGKYKHDSLGMFGSGKMTFKNDNPKKEEVIKFIKLIIDINNEKDDKKIIDILANSKFEMSGLKKGMLSQFLHCIKPNIFPIVNSWGIEIYNKLEVKIDKDNTINGYLNDIKNIKNFMDENQFEFKNYRVIDLLGSIMIGIIKRKKQIILQGAPGTGKTYSSAEIAVELIDKNASYDRKKLMKRYKELVDKGQIFFTTFHQSMDYEEFVEGIKPRTVNNNIIYELNDGIFKKACEMANKNKKVVLIIDEINRGNISKIFGELITLLEADKRKGEENEIEVILPYSKEKFSVPNNLYIIGTMNTADRSIGYIDYALRRRFAFYTIEADETEIENYYDNIKPTPDCKDEAIKLFDETKKLIKENINEEFKLDDIMIGHSYFMAKNIEELQNKLDYEIKPLLLEYLKDGVLKGNDIENKINNLNYE